MPNYGRWLRGSVVFDGTTEGSPCTVRLGTTNLDAGPLGKRPGSVTEYDPPRHIAFHHAMASVKGLLSGNADVNIRCTLEPVEGAPKVIRVLDLTIQLPGSGGAYGPVGVSEGKGTPLAELKRYVEA